jgi:hypothetical protein
MIDERLLFSENGAVRTGSGAPDLAKINCFSIYVLLGREEKRFWRGNDGKGIARSSGGGRPWLSHT